MGLVVEARHRQLKRRVALKLRHRDQGGDERLLAERFRRGAVMQAGLDHSHIVIILDYIELPDLQAIVMEFLAGGTVEERVRDGGLMPVADVVEVGIRAADALSYAHAEGVVHRDIKPGNLIFHDADDPGSVRLTDFGVARDLGRRSELTVAGANVGTLWYMPPEQFNNEAPTPQVDVYALGATLYEMLTGQIPFARASHAEIFRRFLDKEPPPPILERNPRVPEPLIAVVESALALEREDRLPSAAAMSGLLRAVAGLIDAPTSGERSPRSRGRLVEAMQSLPLLSPRVEALMEGSLRQLATRAGVAEETVDESVSGLPGDTEGSSLSLSAGQVTEVTRQTIPLSDVGDAVAEARAARPTSLPDQPAATTPDGATERSLPVTAGLEADDDEDDGDVTVVMHQPPPAED